MNDYLEILRQHAAPMQPHDLFFGGFRVGYDVLVPLQHRVQLFNGWAMYGLCCLMSTERW